VDGFRVAEDLRKLNPQAFRLLSNVQLEHFFSSADESYSHRGSTIQLDDQGRVRSFRYNQANRRPLDVPSELMLPMYEALKEFTNMIRSPEYLLKFRLKEGDMLVFNNHRLLHGRTSYDPQVIGRHLNGCYLDLEQFESKCSIMHRSMTKKRGYQQSMGGQRRGFSTNAGLGPGHQQSIEGQRRGFSTNVGLDPGYDEYDQKFVDEALAPYKEVIESGEEYEDGSSLQKVVHQEHADFKALKDGTKADMVYQCALFGHDWETNAVNRIIGMLKKLEGEHIRLGTGAQVDLFEHSVQCATLAYLDDQDEEMIVMSLLHDIGEMMSPTNHGEIAGAILRPFISPERYWILAHHEIFQGYYYFHHVGGNRNTRDLYKDHEMYQPTVDFCEKYDQAAFDPDYESLPIDFFKPMLKRTFERTPYFWYPNHPKLGVVTIQDDVEEEDVAPVSV
jgi:predicted HD phosphohydrolase